MNYFGDLEHQDVLIRYGVKNMKYQLAHAAGMQRKDHKYIERKGSPGHYTYIYEDDKSTNGGHSKSNVSSKYRAESEYNSRTNQYGSSNNSTGSLSSNRASGGFSKVVKDFDTYRKNLGDLFKIMDDFDKFYSKKNMDDNAKTEEFIKYLQNNDPSGELTTTFYVYLQRMKAERQAEHRANDGVYRGQNK